MRAFGVFQSIFKTMQPSSEIIAAVAELVQHTVERTAQP